MKRSVIPASRIIFVALSLMMAAVVSKGLVSAFAPARHVDGPQPQKKVKTYDPVLLARLNRLAHSMDMLKPCAYEGVVNMTDGADSANNVHNAQVVFCKSGDDCYYRYGSMEMINRGGFNIYIQHEQKSIWVSRQKPVSADAMPGPSTLPDLAAENYELSSVVNGAEGIISLKNSKHVTCKEYTLTYDTRSEQVKFVHARLSDIHDPLNSSKDKLVDMQISGWTGQPDFRKYPDYTSIISTSGEIITLRAEYKDYSLTNTVR